MAELKQAAANAARAEEGRPVTIYQGNEEPYTGADGKPSTITVVGRESKAYRDARAAIQRRALHSGATRVEPADLLKNRIDQAAAAVVDWSGWEAEGQPWPCAPENVKALLGIEHILEQVEVAIAQHARFFASSSPR